MKQVSLLCMSFVMPAIFCCAVLAMLLPCSKIKAAEDGIPSLSAVGYEEQSVHDDGLPDVIPGTSDVRGRRRFLVAGHDTNGQWQNWMTSNSDMVFGKASWYGAEFHGRRTAMGNIFDMNELTAAHRTLPLGTMVQVTVPDTGRSVMVRITDRGPYISGRILDLSMAAAETLGIKEKGIEDISFEIMHNYTQRSPD